LIKRCKFGLILKEADMKRELTYLGNQFICFVVTVVVAIIIFLLSMWYGIRKKPHNTIQFGMMRALR